MHKMSETIDESKGIPTPSPDVVHGEGSFIFPNGDKYFGEYIAKKHGRFITKHGYGEYITWDGHVYKGKWIEDLLNPSEDICIDFCDNSKYKGIIVQGKYSGLGSYTFPDKSLLICEFQENKPQGKVEFLDKDGFLWIGDVNENIKLLQLNTFYSTCYTKPKSEKSSSLVGEE